jgi:hypothetical protein
MSTPAIQVADPNVVPTLPQAVQPVTVILGDQQIGTGEVVNTHTGIRVTGHYQWPPDAPAEVGFLFDFVIQSANTCEVAVSWPGLIPEIPQTRAGYIMLLLMARPDFLITTPSGDHITAAFLGPFGHPEITTALQVSVAIASGAASQSLVFRYDGVI